MKVNFKHEFKDENGKDIKHGVAPKAIFGALAVQALLNAKKDETQGEPGAKEKRHRYDLAVRIKNFGSEALLSKEDVELLSGVMGQAYHTLIAGPALFLLEGKEIPQMIQVQEPAHEAEAEHKG